MRTMPMGLLGMVALVAAVEVGLHALEDPYLATFDREAWRLAGESAAADAPGAEVLLLGDSTIKVGVDPMGVEAASGLSAVNLAAYGAPPAFGYFTLRRAVEAGARPRAVVVGYMPGNLQKPPHFYTRYWSPFTNARETIELAWADPFGGFVGELVSGWALTSYRRRGEVRDRVERVVRGEDPFEQVELYRGCRDAWARGKGAGLHEPTAWTHAGVNTQDRAIFLEHWGVEPAAGLYLNRLLDLASKIDAQVYYVAMPISPAYQQELDRIGQGGRLTEMLRKLQAKHPGMVVVDARHANYPDAAFIDAHHMNLIGASRLSRGLGEIVRSGRRDRADAPRWTAMPEYGPGPEVQVPITAGRPSAGGPLRR